MYHINDIILYSYLILYSFPEHIKKAVERYAVLTNVQPNVYTEAQRDARLRTARESYPLEKAVFVPRDLINKHGCGTLNITEDDIKQIHDDLICDRPPGKIVFTVAC